MSDRWLTYIIDEGLLLSDALSVMCLCYSGMSECKNDPTKCGVKDRGPLPPGIYTVESPIDTTLHGPAVMWLVPDPTNSMMGRAGFGIHSDAVHAPGMASEGCIVNVTVAPEVTASINPKFQWEVSTSVFRRWLWSQGYNKLRVIATRTDLTTKGGDIVEAKTQPTVGAHVIYVDPVARQHDAMVTAVWGPTCINVVFVSSDESKTDSYGRQIERQTSLSHRSGTPAHGQYYMLPGDTPNPVVQPTAS